MVIWTLALSDRLKQMGVADLGCGFSPDYFTGSCEGNRQSFGGSGIGSWINPIA
jgi:hypothetical protein